MKLENTPLLVACVFACLSTSMSLADPLHPAGNDGTWRHEYSGWQFPKQVGEFERVQLPYTIDGNNDVGVQYERIAGASRVTALVEVYLADSAAPIAKLDGAKAQAAHKAGEAARLRSEQSFNISADEHFRGTKVTYAVDAESRSAQTSLYFFATDHCVVKVLGSTGAPEAETAKALDDFVQALPWSTLGDPAALHLH